MPGDQATCDVAAPRTFVPGERNAQAPDAEKPFRAPLPLRIILPLRLMGQSIRSADSWADEVAVVIEGVTHIAADFCVVELEPRHFGSRMVLGLSIPL
ncbi:hypothetical protein GCM10009528_45490 [Kineococcus aurantiacus]